MLRPSARWRRGAAAAAAILALTACSGSATEPPTPHPKSASITTGSVTTGSATTSSEAVPRDFAAIRALLSARAHAVVTGNEAAFLAQVDKTDPWFYATQHVMYENLRDLPVTSMSYEVGNSGLTNAPGIHGGPLLTPEVVEHVFFANTDTAPIANDVHETFVRRSGGWLLAADSTDSSEPTSSTARPWAGPAISVATRGHLIVVADKSSSGTAVEIANVVKEDLTFIARILDVPVNDHLMVDATTGGSVMKFSNDESAAAVTFPVTASRDFRTTVDAGLRVKLNPGYIPELSWQPMLLRHELTHYLTWKYAGFIPRWLSEGLAEYVANQPAGMSAAALSPADYKRLMERPRELTVSGLYGQDPATDYPLAAACVTHLVEHGGIRKVERLMRAYTTFTDEPFGGSHTNHLLHVVYGVSSADLARGAFTLLQDLR